MNEHSLSALSPLPALPELQLGTCWEHARRPDADQAVAFTLLDAPV